jgi:hypothetical protein
VACVRQSSLEILLEGQHNRLLQNCQKTPSVAVVMIQACHGGASVQAAAFSSPSSAQAPGRPYRHLLKPPFRTRFVESRRAVRVLARIRTVVILMRYLYCCYFRISGHL